MPGLLRRNPEFAKLWSAQVVSQAGDWLNKVAALSVIEKLVGGGAAVVGVGLWFALEQALRLLPTTLLSPFAGPVADRVPRKLLLVGGDFLRALLVLCYLTIDTREELPLVAVLIAVQMGLAIFFDAARQASLPSTVRTGDLHGAITWSAATWSTMLSIGALAGGLLVDRFGTNTAFVVDAGTYVASALLYVWIRLPPAPKQDEPFRWREFLGLRDIRRGWEHARGIGIAPALLTKAFWGGAGGMLVLIALASRTRFGAESGEHSFAFAFGVLFASRGVGTAIGPFLARRVFGHRPLELIRSIRAGFLLAPLAYAAFGLADSLWLAALLVGIGHIGGGAIWVSSTSIWQQTVHDRFRGRVHALDFFGMTLSFSFFALVTGLLFDLGLDVTTLAFVTAASIAAMGAVWWALSARMRRRLEPDEAIR